MWVRGALALTERTGGRRVAASDHVDPASAVPKTSPDVDPKYSSRSDPLPAWSNARRRIVR